MQRFNKTYAIMPLQMLGLLYAGAYHLQES
jgi:hypothetical protein